MLVDSYHRSITYLRLSVTDRCNLRCRYCMPESGVNKISHEDILTYEEFLRVVRAAASQGMTKVRLTGGEPLIRKGILDFIRVLSSVPGILDLRLTTNGVLLSDMAADLLVSGLRRVNISLDSLDRQTYHKITGRDELDRAWRGIETALEKGFDRVKINCVPIRGLNDHEVPDIARLSLDLPVEVRFIEFMPLGRMDFWTPEKMVSSQELKRRLEEAHGPLSLIPHRQTEGPARVFQWPGAKGTLGFISPVTDHFCAACNRLRLTADGKLRLCLLSNLEFDLKEPLRRGASLDELAGLLKQAVAAKPADYFLDQKLRPARSRSMNLIGG